MSIYNGYIWKNAEESNERNIIPWREHNTITVLFLNVYSDNKSQIAIFFLCHGKKDQVKKEVEKKKTLADQF